MLFMTAPEQRLAGFKALGKVRVWSTIGHAEPYSGLFILY